MRRLTLVPFLGGSYQRLAGPLCQRLDVAFRRPTRVEAPAFDARLAHDDARGQFNSRTLLAMLRRQVREGDHVLGLTAVDLFIPVLTFVFGEAQLRGPTALVSLYRLREEAYGLPTRPLLLEDRLAKEAIHELGHTLGLVHCERSRCVMQASTCVEEIDLKGERFCGRCRRVVNAVCG